MTLPLVYMDVIHFASFLAIFLAVGVFIGWNLSRWKPTETQNLLTSMRRADHFLDSYIVSIQGNGEDLIKEFPVDVPRWKNSMDLIIQSAARMDEHVKRLRLIRRGLEPYPQHSMNLGRPHAGSDTGPTGSCAGRRHIRIGPEVYVEVRPLRALEKDTLAAINRAIQQERGVRHVPLDENMD